MPINSVIYLILKGGLVLLKLANAALILINTGSSNVKDLKLHLVRNADLAGTYLQLPLRQWGAGNVYLLVLSTWKVNIAKNPIAVMGLYIRSGLFFSEASGVQIKQTNKLLFTFGTFDSFLSFLCTNWVYGAYCSSAQAAHKLVQQNRQPVLRACCLDIYTVT